MKIKFFSLAIILAIFTSFASSVAFAQQNAEDGRGQGLFTAEWHAARRAILMDEIGKGLIVLRGAGTQNDYREFRQDNNFWYYTGITTPNAVLILAPESGEEYLLVPPVDAMKERWSGDLIDPEEAAAITGIKQCMPTGKKSRTVNYDNLEKSITKLLRGCKVKTIHVQEQPAENWMMSRDNLMSAAKSLIRDPYDQRKTREAQFAKKIKEKHECEVKDITVTLDALRVTKTPEEVAAMRRACEVSGVAHINIMRTARAGEYEWQLAARMTGDFLEESGLGAAYMAIVGSGINATVLHYTANNCQLELGDTVMIDYGAEFAHYVADISRTFPVADTFSDRQREIYQAVYDAQEAAFTECKPGSNLNRVHNAAFKVLKDRGFGSDFWHGTSHWLGMATHDVGNFRATFEPGMAFTVEPGVYLPDEGIGVRIEDVVVITENGYELISESIPRHIDEIEALRAIANGHKG